MFGWVRVDACDTTALVRGGTGCHDAFGNYSVQLRSGDCGRVRRWRSSSKMGNFGWGAPVDVLAENIDERARSIGDGQMAKFDIDGLLLAGLFSRFADLFDNGARTRFGGAVLAETGVGDPQKDNEEGG